MTLFIDSIVCKLHQFVKLEFLSILYTLFSSKNDFSFIYPDLTTVKTVTGRKLIYP